jgi:hypothetical protein
MENVLYEATIVPAAESQDGETPTMLRVTKETNFHALTRESYEDGLEVIAISRYHANMLIESAVDLAREEKARRAETTQG